MKYLLITLIWLPTTFFTIFLSLIYLHGSLNNTKELSSKLKIQANQLASLPSILGTNTQTVFAVEDARPLLLENFFAKYRSPLLSYSQYIVEIADKYGLDYALIPAMAMQESQACLRIPEGSNNCWGYGIYGDKVLKFESYEQGIETVAKTLKEKYVEDSLTNPDLIMSRWTPSSNGSWSSAVNLFMQEIKQGL